MREIKRDEEGHFLKGHTGFRDEANGQWKGDKAGYTAIHDWVYIHLGTPKKCEGCDTKTAKKYEWANLSGKYERIASDWKRLCTSCHRKHDGHSLKAWVTRRKYAA